MVAKLKSMQFFLRDARDEATVLRVIGAATGFAVESADVPVAGSGGFLQVEDFADGFNQGYLVSSPACIAWRCAEPDAARELATRLSTDVLVELPDDQWLLAIPSGDLRLVAVEMFDDGIDVVGPVVAQDPLLGREDNA